jgi:general secretion pathway protein F
MTRQLASLVKAHVPIVESFSALIEQIDHPRLKSVLGQIRQTVKEGKSLGDGFEQFPKIFNRVYVNMVKAGESSGRLDVVLLRLADFQENQVKLRGKVMGAMMYPIIMLVVGTLILGVIFVKVIPQITKIFDDMKTQLPAATKFLIWMSDFLGAYGLFLLFGVMGLGVMLERYIATEAGRRKKDAFLLKVPVLKELVRTLAVARFARTLGTLLQSGVPMLGALLITRNVVNHVNFEDAIDQASTQVSEGRSLSGAIKQTGEFPPIVVHMVGVGEKTGELEGMLLNVAVDYEQQMEMKLTTLTGLLEPLMIVVMAGAVGFIVMAVLLPIFNMNQFG